MPASNNYSHGAGQPELISSRNNPAVRAIRALAARKDRDRTGQCFIEGLHLVAAAIQAGAAVETCVLAPDLLSSAFGRELAAQAARRGARQLLVSADVFRSLAAKEQAQGLGLVVRQRWQPLASATPDDGHCWVALDAVQYPGNLGAILRTCDAVGCAGAILLGDTADPYDPAAVRASVGAIFGQQLVRASLAEFMAWKHRHSVLVVGTAPAATLDYRSVAYRRPVVLLMGSEPRGLGADLLGACDLMVGIPMIGQGDSLNLAVAASVVLYEIFNQQREREAA